MSRRLLLCLLPAFAACGSDPVPVFADMQWQVRCEIARGCTASPARNIMHLDGEMGHEVSCSVTRTPSGDLSLAFDVRMGDEFGMSVRNAVFPAAGGGLIGGGCSIDVIDNSNTYEGMCGANFPNETQHCRISEVAVTDEREGRTIAGKVLCINIPQRTDRSRVREVTLPASPFNAMDPTTAVPATFRFVGCAGL